MAKRTGKIGSKKIVYGEITETRAELLEAFEVIQDSTPEFQHEGAFIPISHLHQLTSQTNLGAVRCLADRMMKLGYLTKQVPDDREAEYALTDQGRETLVAIGEHRKRISAKPEEEVPPKTEVSCAAEDDILYPILQSMDAKLDQLVETIPTINRIKGIYTRVDEVKSLIDETTWRTSISNRQQLRTIMVTQASIAETLLELCESVSSHVTKLANLVYVLPRPSESGK